MRVLVVAQDAMERMRAVSALTLHGQAEVVEARDEREGRAALDERAVDVLIVDGDLRPEGGFSVVYALRQHAQLIGAPTPPAIVLIARDQDRWLADWAGANAVLLKPVDAFTLADMTHRLVGVEGSLQGAHESGEQIADLLAAHEHGEETGLTPA